MDRKTTIKVLREIIRLLKDESLFLDSDFDSDVINNKEFNSIVKNFIIRKLDL